MSVVLHYGGEKYPLARDLSVEDVRVMIDKAAQAARGTSGMPGIRTGNEPARRDVATWLPLPLQNGGEVMVRLHEALDIALVDLTAEQQQRG